MFLISLHPFNGLFKKKVNFKGLSYNFILWKQFFCSNMPKGVQNKSIIRQNI